MNATSQEKLMSKKVFLKTRVPLRELVIPSKYFREATLLEDHAQGGLGISQQHSGNSLSSPEVCLPVWESSENGFRPEIQKPR